MTTQIAHLNAVVSKSTVSGRQRQARTIPSSLATPVSKFVLSMQGGHKGLLENSQNICAPHAKTHALVHLVAQSGRVLDTTPVIANSCGRHMGKKHRHG
jgi:hypothetical protein